ncbi:MAG: bifunctional hydroxymethylpyrimidine kinase/phosphomethylpyrimidine kinase [Nitrososphaerota archaeon]|nr:bifunctional hydroxymethylpyrimidine kinase/phosphomethylpyrimidine kinase [Candidatus Bathyarchaeota archaeon]MDW8048243.1 bifunctional hydroxymethylpyrimidine kinase/phosphomethylpyrimidine kinase [Nitrososphaerota archaeon]
MTFAPFKSVSSRLKRIPCAMTVAGSDSSGGAGIEADLKTFCALGVHGACVVTAVTSQNTRGVYDIYPVDPDAVKRQMETILEDIHVDSVKTGMLYSKEVINVVSEMIDKYDLKAVVDPVLSAGTGDPLIVEDGLDALVKILLPKAKVATPNIIEAEVILKTSIRNLEDAKDAAKKIAQLGPKTVVLKGGHLKLCDDKVYDVVCLEDGAIKIFEKKRVLGEFHGLGCVFSAAIAGHMALGSNLKDAVERAEGLISEVILNPCKIGHGRAIINPVDNIYRKSERFQSLLEVQKAIEIIESRSELSPFIAEVGTQIGMAIPFASNFDDVAAVEGRIVKVRGKPKAVGQVCFGASRHIASVILAVMEYNPEMRAALNLRYDRGLIEAFKKAGYRISCFDRRLEPATAKEVEGSTLDWGVREAIRSLGGVPDVIFDLGDVGKEPMIRVIGKTASDVLHKTLEALKHL